MSETRWTPGPFSVSYDGANTYRAEVVAPGRAGRKAVVVARIPTPNRNPQQAAGNADLFAAAPDLYEALAEALPWLELRSSVETVAKARAALAKARGES